MTSQQEDVLHALESHDRILAASANNIGKTWLAALWAIYRFDAVASLPDPDSGLEEQGCRVLLPGPSHDTVKHTIYAKILSHASRAERRGFAMPGGYRGKERWIVRPEWETEIFAPKQQVDENVSATASGRHHRNQVAIIEEAKGAAEPLWEAVEGMCSGEGNVIFAIFNPTEGAGPAYKRSKMPGWKIIHLSAFDHPNVRGRSIVVPGAISFRVVDNRVESCRDRGAWPRTKPERKHNDFVYALPPRGTKERGARRDGKPGHPDGELRVYRPDGQFEAQVLGVFPSSADDRLFPRPLLEAAVERFRAREAAGTLPVGPPDCVGLDPAREGEDDSALCPRWGSGAEELLRAAADAAPDGPEAVAAALAGRRIVLGEIQIGVKGDGPAVAEDATARFPASPFNVDEGGVGASSSDHLRRVLLADVTPVSFGASPPPSLQGEPISENKRTSLAVRLAWLFRLEVVDLAPDPLLIEELLAYHLKHKYRTVEVRTPKGVVKMKKPSVLLLEKDEVKAMIGRSPDRGDAAMLAADDGEVRISASPGLIPRRRTE